MATSFQYSRGLVQLCPVLSNSANKPSCLIACDAIGGTKFDISIDEARLPDVCSLRIVSPLGDNVALCLVPQLCSRCDSDHKNALSRRRGGPMSRCPPQPSGFFSTAEIT